MGSEAVDGQRADRVAGGGGLGGTVRAVVAQAGGREEQARSLPSQSMPWRTVTSRPRHRTRTGRGAGRAVRGGAGRPRSSRVTHRVRADDGADPPATAPSPLAPVRVGHEGHRAQGRPTGAHQLPAPRWTPPKPPVGRPVFPGSPPISHASPWPDSRHLGPQPSRAHRTAQRFRPGRRTHGSAGTVTHRASRTIDPQQSTPVRFNPRSCHRGCLDTFHGDIGSRGPHQKRKRGPLSHSQPNSGHHRTAVRYG